MSLPQVSVISDPGSGISFIVRTELAEGTKARLVLGREIQESL